MSKPFTTLFALLVSAAAYASAPTTTTTPASLITSTGAQLNGTINPNGEATTGWFRIATTNPVTCNDTFGSRVPISGGTGVGSGTVATTYSVATVGLLPGTQYWFCAIASNASAMTVGNPQTFTTPAELPTVTTISATNVTSSGATLTADANPNGSNTTAFFRWYTSNPGSCNNSTGTRAPATGGTTLTGNGTTAYNEPITGLAAGVTYWYCAIATNAVGTTLGNLLSFTTLVAVPSVNTGSVSSLSGTSATFTGTANPNGSSTTAWFRYAPTDPGSCNDAFGSRAPTSGGSNLGSGSSFTSFSQTANSLTPGTRYYYCAIAQNGVGIAFGTVQSVVTPSVPTLTTQAATLVTANAAQLNGMVNPNGDYTYAYYRYSPTNPGTCNDSFGSYSSTSYPGSGNTAVAMPVTVGGLSPGTLYYYCAIAYNGVGYGYGTVLTFTTPPVLPTVSAGSTSSLTGTTVTLSATTNPGGDAATAWFRYSTVSPGTCNDTFGTRAPASGGSAIPTGNSNVAFTQDLAGLVPGTTYYFCGIAQNSVGFGYGAMRSFTTSNVPTVTTSSGGYSSSTQAYLYGTTTANGSTATAYFRYSTTNPGSCNDTFGTRAPATGGTTVTSTSNVSQVVNGLTPGTTYYFCALATNAVGTGMGAVLSFAMPSAPTITTVAQTNLLPNSATLNGTGLSNGDNAYAYFRWSATNPVTCDDNFGTYVGGRYLGTGTTPVDLTYSLTGLAPGTTYYYCAIGYNVVGYTFGTLLSFTTPAQVPLVTTSSTSSVTGTTATLAGLANPRGAMATAWFRYSTTSPGSCNDTFGTRAPSTGGTDVGAGNSSVAFNQAITGLTPGTTYYVCAIAQNSVGTGFGNVGQFTTPNIPTVTTTTPYVYTYGTRTDVYGTINANGATATAYFRYSTVDPGACNDTFGTRYPSTGGQSINSGTSYQYLTSLTPGTTYYVCALATNLVGTGMGAVVSFQTPAAPTVTTVAATSITATGANLNATAIPNGASVTTATGYFRYSTTNPVTCNDSFGTRAPASGGTTLTAGATSVPFSVNPATLLPGNTYYYCALAYNDVGTGYGQVLSFSTPPLAPSVVTSTATGITSSGATLQGSTNPNGATTTAWFRYSTTSPGTCNDTFGTRVPATGGTTIPTGNSYVAHSEVLSGLSLATTYYYCAIASNSVGTSYGGVVAFTTSPTAPSVTTLAAASITTTAATLNANAVPNGAAAIGWFRFFTSDPGTCNDTGGTRFPSSGGTTLGSGLSGVPYSVQPMTLQPGVTYWFCALASNSAGTGMGAVLTFKTTSTAPTLNTLAASGVGGTNATLNGTANPNGDATTAWFRYATTNPVNCNDTFGTRTPATGGTSLGAGTTSVPFTQALTGLTPGATYYFCAIASSSVGTSLGLVLSFATPNAPAVTTNAATPVTATTATLNADAVPNGTAATGWFRYSATDPGACNDTFGTRLPATGGTNLGSGALPVSYQQAISGLNPGTQYFFCALAQNSVGMSVGALLSFFTPPATPAVTTLAPTAVTATGATMNGTVNPNGAPTTAWVRYSTTNPGTCNDSFGTRSPASGGTSLGSGTSTVPFTQALTGLTSGVTYYACVIANNAVGTTPGGIVSFTTPGAPLVVTGGASLLQPTTATLNGSANPNRGDATGWFRYDTTNPGSCNDTFGTRAPASGGAALGTGSTSVAYSQAITGLTAGTTYWFCAIASNVVGTAFGTPVSFTTPLAPTVVTQAPSVLGSSSATLSATANPNLTTATGWFRYYSTNPGACSDTGGTRTPSTGGTALGAGSTPVAYTAPTGTLSAGTTYWACAFAQNSIGLGAGSPVSFTTLAVPVVTTSAPTAVTTTSASLEGTANPRGAATTGWFRYSTTNPVSCNDTFGTRAPATGGQALGSGSTAAPYSQAITGLAQGTTYYVCAIASNSVGTAFGTVTSFTTPSGPTVTTSAATALGTTTATLNGSANPRADATTGWFRYSTTSPGTCNDTFGTRAPASGGTSLGSGSTAVAYSEVLTGLTGATTYYFCAIAQNSIGLSFGSVLSFVTPSLPTVTTNAATSIGASSAVLNGSGVANSAATTGWFRISATNPGSCDDTFGTRFPTSGGTSLGSGTSPVAFTQTASGLSGSTTYYFCAIAQNTVGTAFGSVLSFTTPAAPTVTTAVASGITSSGATLNGSANPNGSTATGWFRYSTTNPVTCNDTFGTRTPLSGGTALGSGSIAQSYTATLTGLLGGTTYYYCAIASNTVGTSFGAPQSFSTAGPPLASTLAATGVSASGATLNGTGTPKGDPTTGYFRYSTVNPGSCTVSFGTRAPSTGGTALGSGTTAVPFSEVVTGLASATTYYFCAFAGNSIATGVGTVMSFTTTSGPAVTTSAATAVASTSATLNGSANPRSDATTGWYRYSTTNPGACNDTFGTRAPSAAGTSLGSGASAVTYSENLTGLNPGTTYWFCAIAQNSFGTSFGAVLSFFTPAAPAATTSAATSVTASSATFNGAATPNGSSTTAWFRYATTSPGTCNDTFGTRTPATGGTSLGAGTTSSPFTQAVTGLAQGTTYYYCAVAQNAIGYGYGAVQSFTTPQGPSVTSVAASAITASTAQLNGTANPNGLATTGWFRWSATNPGACSDAFGTRAPSTGGLTLGTGSSATPYNQAISGLTPGQTYYFCAIAQNAVSTSFGAVLSFTATTSAPVVTTNAVSAVTGTDATLNGSANPGGDATTGWFRYSTTNPGTCDDAFGTRAPLGSGGTSLGSGTSASGFSQTVTALTMGATYYFCAIAQNSRGTSFGSVQSFVVPRPPTVATSAASALTGTGATLNGTANPNSAATTGWFRYATVSPGACNDTFGTRAPASGGAAVGAGVVPAAYTQNVTGLSPGTTYFVCAIASNVAGTSVGTVQSFKTPSAPTVMTSSASNVMGSSATLNGAGNPNGLTTTAWFRYSTTNPVTCNDTFGIRAPSSSGQSLGTGSTNIGYSLTLNGLTPGQTYYFCAIAENAIGKGFGTVVPFNVMANPPLVSTQPATDVAGRSATLNGAITPNLSETTAWFRIDTKDPGACDDMFGTRVPETGGTSMGSGAAAQPLALSLLALKPNTTYYYCAIASNLGGASFGGVVSFVTPKLLPVVTTVSAATEEDGSISIVGEGNPNGAETTGYFRYDLSQPAACSDLFGTKTPEEGIALGAGSEALSFSKNLSGLTPGTYWFCAAATNDSGTAFGELKQFTVLAASGGCGCGSTSPGALVLLAMGALALRLRRRVAVRVDDRQT